MLAQILWFFTWPVLIVISYYVVRFALKKAGLL
jgi:hypothetical protein